MRLFRLVALTAFLVAFSGVGVSLAQPAIPTPPYAQTVIVTSGSTPATNGANLLFAIANVPATAGPTEPWTILVEAGIYDLGTDRIVMRDFIDIVGAGRNATFIRSTRARTNTDGGTVLVPSGIDAEMTNLTIQNFSNSTGYGIGNKSTEFKLTKVNIEVDVGGSLGLGFVNFLGNPRLSAVFPRVTADTGKAQGVRIENGGPIINEMFVFIDSAGSDNTGINILSTSSPIIEQASLVVFGGSNNNFGVNVQDSATPRLTNLRVQAFGGSEVRGVSSSGSSVTDLKEASVSVASASFRVSALAVFSATATVSDTTLSASSTIAGSTSFGVINDNASVEIRTSTVEGTTRGARNLSASSQTFLGSSQLAGGPSAAAGSILRCAQSYDGAFNDIGPGCI